ncbi:glutaredoxin family protein [Thalassolituus sp. ST750PaO-4]|uniref:glutaredoxin family protein n=1 Tax=Thalassolituus sp. ST750PaO-4 TaxID=2742965 RepID=UPI000C4B39B9|nr:glutaredoxin family protein [Thalassolituus sp. ST750PaO-4]MCA6059642.1 glutaredoxin family protein [Thalassolituus sp. ST750PaO-4]PIQ39408.1 MAG: thioredoxin family protein [Thalassolituus sp. CG17_big_fil_post_rev_8_21_14_2_50_53_8]
MALVLFGTEACHLCDLAQAVIVNVAGQISLDVYVEDIAETEALVERYGLRIPVLLNEQNGAELDWPFDETQLLNWLQSSAQPEPISE